MTGASLWTSASAVSAERSANERIVVGVMGLNRGRTLATNFGRQPGVEVRYACDADLQRAESAAAGLEKAIGHKPKAIQDYRRILDDAQVDAFVCAAPNHWHAPATILACAAGKHVYCEKPCCHNPHEGELMVQAARKHARCVQMGSQRRSSPGTMEAMQKLHEGTIGRVYLARCWYHNVRPSLGRGKPAPVPPNLDYELWQGPAPRVPYVDNRIHYNWHWFWHWGNGELGNNGVHTLDLCRWGLGVDFPTHATSSGGRYRYDDDQETPDTHTVGLEFDNKQAITWQGLSCNKHGGGHKFVMFHGEDGALELDSNGTYRIFDARDKLVAEQKGSEVGDVPHIQNFLKAIRDNTPDQLNAEIAKGYRSTLLCHLGNMAYRTGRALHCDPKDGRAVGDEDAMQYWQRDYAPGWEPKV